MLLKQQFSFLYERQIVLDSRDFIKWSKFVSDFCKRCHLPQKKDKSGIMVLITQMNQNKVNVMAGNPCVVVLRLGKSVVWDTWTVWWQTFEILCLLRQGIRIHKVLGFVVC